jgi:hypothetical protein
MQNNEAEISEDSWQTVCERAALLRALWEADPNPRFGASRAARVLGLSSKQLNELLVERGLPPYGLLHQWYLAVWLHGQARKCSLARIGWRLGRDPATYYRFVERVVRTSWKDLMHFSENDMRSRALEEWTPHLGRRRD